MKLCLEQLCNADFMMTIAKSAFLVSEMEMLGHMVTKNNIRPMCTLQEVLVKANRAPQTVGDVSRLYGLLSYFR